jgi:O-antigen/teichoic acid export membrane protein
MVLKTRRIIINAVSGSGARIAALTIAFLTTPILINKLGAEEYGLFAIVAALPAYAGLLDLGIGSGLIRHYAEHSERGDSAAIRQITTLSLCFYVLLGAVFLPLIFCFAPSLVTLFSIPEHLWPAAEISIAVMFVYFILYGVTGIFSARLVSLDRMDIAEAIGLLGQSVYGVLVFIVIPISPTVLTAVSLNLIQLVVTGPLLYAVVLRTDLKTVCNPLSIPGALIRKISAFGGWMQVNSLAALVNLEADKLIIASFLGVATVTPYQIGNRLASLNRLIPFQLLSAIMPTATAIHLSRTIEDREKFYKEASRYLMLLTILVTGFITVAAENLIVAWIGQPYPDAALILLALAFTFSVNNLTGVGTTMLRAAGQPRHEAYYALLSMVLNVCLTVVLAPYFGLVGVLAGTVVANLIGSTYFLILFHRRSGFRWNWAVGSWLWKLVVAGALACLGTYLAIAWAPACSADGTCNGRTEAVIALGFYGILYLTLLLGGLTLLGFWSREDIDVLRRALPYRR